MLTVDLYGQCADYVAIEEICDEYEVPVIEDAAEALGATYGSRKAGAFGRCAAFSFNGNKIITTSGGGMLTLREPRIIERARHLATRRLVRLGGSARNALHWRFITCPLIVLRRGDDRHSRQAEYCQALATAVAHDMRGPRRSPAFYALLIYSNGRSPLPESPCWRAIA